MHLDQLRELVRTCTGPHASSFYRNLYGMQPDAAPLEIHTIEDWLSLPTCSKSHLSAVPIYERAFPPWSSVASIFASSGTSGNPPVFSPHAPNNGYLWRSAYHSFTKATLVSIPPIHKKEWEIEQLGSGHAVAMDPKHISATVELARAAGVDSMFVFLFHVPLVAEAMKRAGIADAIRYIELAGEPCTHSLFTYIRTVFPNAVITSEYSSSESEALPIGVLCHPINGTEPLEVFHENEQVHLEILDPVTRAVRTPEAGVEGELLVTSYMGPHASFPLIRYSIGDSVRVVDTACTEHGRWSFHVLGRTEMDFIKVPGGVLRADEVERVLRTMSDEISDYFELHCADALRDGIPSLQVTLKIQVRATTNMQELATRIALELRLAPHYTYADGVRDGYLLPLVCEPLTEISTGKHRRMFRT